MEVLCSYKLYMRYNLHKTTTQPQIIPGTHLTGPKANYKILPQ